MAINVNNSDKKCSRVNFPVIFSFLHKENVIYLKKWMVMRSSNGLFVDGVHR